MTTPDPLPHRSTVLDNHAFPDGHDPMDGHAFPDHRDAPAGRTATAFVQLVSVRANFGPKLRRTLEEGEAAVNRLIHSYDPTLADHHGQVAQLAMGIARRLGLPPDEVRGIGLAASIHDVGTIGMAGTFGPRGAIGTADPTSIHAHSGASIVEEIRFPWPIATMIHQHHERLDGSGFPDGLDGRSLLLGSRVIAVADAVASRTELSPTLGVALSRLGTGRGTLFDPEVVDACLSLFPQRAEAVHRAPIRGS